MLYVVGHEPIDFKLNNHYTYYNTSELYKINPDDMILQSHQYLNEWVVQYYLYKYTDLTEDIYGFCHYRRVIDYKDIDSEKIQNSLVQIFTTNINFLPYSTYLTLLKDNIQDYQLIYCYIVRQMGSKFLYYSFVEYINTFSFDIQNKWQIKTTFNHVQYIGKIISDAYCPLKTCPGRELYAMNKDNFINMTKFIEGYINFIFNKLHIHTTNDIDNIFSDVHKSGLVEDYLIEESWYNWIKTNNYYHRIIAYMIELLVGLYIHVNYNTFYANLIPNSFKNDLRDFAI